MRSREIPNFIQRTDNRDSRPTARIAANGLPLSVRIARGSPYSRNNRSNTGQACDSETESKPSMPNRKRLYPSATVNG